MILHSFKKIIGWRNWSVLTYNSFIENFFIVFFIAFVNRDYSDFFLIDIFIFYLLSFVSTSYGYLVNDFSDIELDRQHKKKNTFDSFSSLNAKISVISFFVISALISSFFWGKPYFFELWLAWFLISTFYSLKPIRLKERGQIGLIFIVLAQRVIPVLMLISAFNLLIIEIIFLFSVYVFFRGLSSDVNHQLTDYINDKKSKTKTFAIVLGQNATNQLFSLSLEVEKILLASIMLGAVFYLNYIEVLPFLIILVLSIFYWIGYTYNVFLILSSNYKINKNPFLTGKSIFQFLHHAFPTVVLSIGLTVALMFYNWKYLFVLIFLFLIHRLFSFRTLQQSFISQIFKE